ncbi:MAG: hypothetical protein ACLP52_11885 [Streptosporangiaceae bacterium]
MGRTPAHAGHLSWWERLTFAVVFMLMAVAVAMVALSAGRPAAPSAAVAAGQHAAPTARISGPPAGQAHSARPRGTGAADSHQGIRLHQQFVGALARLAAIRGNHFAVGVAYPAARIRAIYHGSERFTAVGIARVDILAGLLLRRQSDARPLSQSDRRLAVAMMDDHSPAATAELWRRAGGTRGIARANIRLRLWRTRPGRDGHWQRTTTTVDDQLRLLADLRFAPSPLGWRSRALALRLLREHPVRHRGVAWTAQRHTTPAAETGQLARRPGNWMTDSIGVVRHGGHVLLIAVLTNQQPSQRAADTLVRAAAVQAVRELRDAASVGHPAGRPGPRKVGKSRPGWRKRPGRPRWHRHWHPRWHWHWHPRRRWRWHWHPSRRQRGPAAGPARPARPDTPRRVQGHGRNHRPGHGHGPAWPGSWAARGMTLADARAARLTPPD